MTKKKLKIGFIMGGGVSMGAYSAGALSYVIDALVKHYDKEKYSSCVVDVFSGSSAGSAALAITVFEMIKGREVENELKKLWVCPDEGLDIKTLLPNRDDFIGKGELNPSLLKTKQIGDIMERIFEKSNMPVDDSEKNSLFGDEVRISMSLSNLNGMRQDARNEINDGENEQDPATHDTTKTYWHNDSRRFRVRLKNKNISEEERGKTSSYIDFYCNDTKNWKELGETARASGAFPFAFPPVGLKREDKEYGRSWGYENEKEKWFHYVDGGVFNNQPLKFAMNMAFDMDKEEEAGTYERVYIVIDPIVGTKKGDEKKENFCSPNYVLPKDFLSQMGENAMSLVEMLTSHAQYKDWQKTGKINNHIQWVKDLVKNMVESSKGMQEAVLETMRKTFENALEDIIRTKYKATSQEKDDKGNLIQYTDEEIGIKSKINTHYEHIKKAYKSDLERLPENQKEYLTSFIALIENIAGIRQKQKVRLIGIAPESKKTTKGDFLGAFGGFFNHEWREHDYKVGQYDAYQKLKNMKNGLVNTEEISIIESLSEYKPEPTYKTVPNETKRIFEKYLGNLTRKGVAKGITNWMLKLAVKLFGKKNILKQLKKDKKEREEAKCIRDKHRQNGSME